MKVYCVILILLAQLAFCQRGHKLIGKSELALKNGNSHKALRLLKKAEKCDYGEMGGNPYASAISRIGILRARAYQQKGELDKALEILDSIPIVSFGSNNIEGDSIKVFILIQKFGKEKVRKAFIENTTSISLLHDEDQSCIEFPELQYRFCFYNEYINSEKESLPFNEMIRLKSFYPLLN